MGHWVTLDDDQHVYISSSGKVLATRGAISSGGGGKERGKALAARSKAAIGRARGKSKPSLREQADKARAAKGTKEQRLYAVASKSNAAQIKLGNKIGQNEPRPGYYKASENKRLAAVQSELKAREAISDERHSKIVQAQQSLATTRAIEHAKAAGPTLREQADKARAGKGTREQRLETLKTKAREQITRRSGNEHLTESKRGPVEASGRAREHLVSLTKAQQSPATTRAIEHAKAAGPSLTNPHLNAAHDVAIKLSSGKLNLENEQALMKHFKADSLSGLYGKLKGYQTDPIKAKALATIGNRKIRK